MPISPRRPEVGVGPPGSFPDLGSLGRGLFSSKTPSSWTELCKCSKEVQDLLRRTIESQFHATDSRTSLSSTASSGCVQEVETKSVFSKSGACRGRTCCLGECHEPTKVMLGRVAPTQHPPMAAGMWLGARPYHFSRRPETWIPR